MSTVFSVGDLVRDIHGYFYGIVLGVDEAYYNIQFSNCNFENIDRLYIYWLDGYEDNLCFQYTSEETIQLISKATK
jgi:hypothetical protein